jgi:hypothetical protein
MRTDARSPVTSALPWKSGNKLRCHICNKLSLYLACHSDERPRWMICFPCFERADRLAKAEDRWPDERDYRKLRDTRCAP